MRRMVFNVEPITKMIPHIIKNTKTEVSFFSKVSSSIIFTLLFSMFRSNKSCCSKNHRINLLLSLHGIIALVVYKIIISLFSCSRCCIIRWQQCRPSLNFVNEKEKSVANIFYYTRQKANALFNINFVCDTLWHQLFYCKTNYFMDLVFVIVSPII